MKVQSVLPLDRTRFCSSLTGSDSIFAVSKSTKLGLHCKRRTQMEELLFCLQVSARQFGVQVTLQWLWHLTKFDKSVFILLHYKVNVNYCWKNWGHPGICQSLHMKVIAGRKLPTVSWWSAKSWVVYVQIHENGITKENVHMEGSGKLPLSLVPKQWTGIF